MILQIINIVVLVRTQALRVHVSILCVRLVDKCSCMHYNISCMRDADCIIVYRISSNKRLPRINTDPVYTLGVKGAV